MARPNKDRIPTDAANSGALFSPFAHLNLEGLPQGPAGEPVAPEPDKPSKLGRVVLRRETAHRAGKCVVVLDGFAPHLEQEYLEELARELRARCGCGGSVKGRTIELQGEQVKKARELLAQEGFQVAGVS